MCQLMSQLAKSFTSNRATPAALHQSYSDAQALHMNELFTAASVFPPPGRLTQFLALWRVERW